MSKDKGKKWDGKSRVSNDLYRKNFNKIFKIKTPYDKLVDEMIEADKKVGEIRARKKLRGNETFDELLEIKKQEEDEEYLKELKDKL